MAILSRIIQTNKTLLVSSEYPIFVFKEDKSFHNYNDWAVFPHWREEQTKQIVP